MLSYPSETGCIYDGNCPECEISSIFVNRQLIKMDKHLRNAAKGDLVGGYDYMFMGLPPAPTKCPDNLV